MPEQASRLFGSRGLAAACNAQRASRNVPGLPGLWLSALRLCGLRWPGGGGWAATLQAAATLP